MARKGENIYKRKDGRWEARYVKSQRSGKTVYGYVYGRSYLDVKNKRTEVIAGLKESAESPESCVDQPSLRRLSEMWLDSLRPSRKASTIVKYTNQLEKHIIPTFGDKCLSDINNEAMIQFGNILQKSDGKGLSSKSASDIISRMKSIRKYALLHGYDVGFVPEYRL